MGSYGIGPARIVAAAIEQGADERGIVWPPSIAPWQVHLVALGKDGEPERETADGLYEELRAGGTEVLYDDRDAGPGEKLTDAELGSFFESATAAAGDGVEAKAIANWVTGDLVALAREAELEPTATAATPEALAALVGLVTAGSVNRGGAREVLAVLVRDGGEPAAIVERLDLGASDSGELEAIVEQAIGDQPDAAAKVKAGEGKAIGAIVGAVMRETRGKADGGEVTRLIRAKLGL